MTKLRLLELVHVGLSLWVSRRGIGVPPGNDASAHLFNECACHGSLIRCLSSASS
jgi:hypothetical protein